MNFSYKPSTGKQLLNKIASMPSSAYPASLMKTNFKLIREEEVAELNGTVKLYRHEQTGAEYLSVENDDNNKVFGIKKLNLS